MKLLREIKALKYSRVYTDEWIQLTSANEPLDDPTVEKPKFVVPYCLIIRYSAHFHEKFKNGLAGMGSRCFPVERCSSKILEAVVTWLFTGLLKVAKRHIPDMEQVGARPRHTGLENYPFGAASIGPVEDLGLAELCEVYICASKNGMPALMNHAITCIYGCILYGGNGQLTWPIVASVFCCDMSISGLKRLLVEVMALSPDLCGSLFNNLDRDKQYVLNAFITRPLMARYQVILRERIERSWLDVNVCDYHEHSSPQTWLTELKLYSR